MSGRVFNRRRTTSVITAAQSLDDHEAFSADSASNLGSSAIASNGPTPRAGRNASYSSSYGLPGRSYIHHAGHHGPQEPIQYSSSGVREQTAELSSSFIKDLGHERVPPRPRADSNLSAVAGASPRTHQPIAELPELESASSVAQEPRKSGLTEAFRQRDHSVSQSTTAAETGSSLAQVQSSTDVPEVVVTNEGEDEMTETSPLLYQGRAPSYNTALRDPEANETDTRHTQGTWDRILHQYPTIKAAGPKLNRIISNPKSWNFHQIAHKVVVQPVSMLPAVFLGLLLNLLDALSYGIILFPLGEEAFKDLGPDGVSMFYVSCIVSQLVYSTGSIFKGGVGSEMIEVVPFFHKMTYLIMAKMGTADPEALRATVITSYAMSSIMTGLVFFGLGAARLGALVSFFPHSILTGCIGGVGIFLFVTGIEVSARLDGSLEFSSATLQKLMAPDTIALWIPPLALAIILLVIRRFYNRPWLVPAYYIGITAIFYIITTAIPSITMTDLRSSGWVFEAPAAGVPFYNFYSYYQFNRVDWKAIWITIPSQLALTFFGILHVPINVPNLAMFMKEDNVKMNRELIMHGISNTLSGCVGSIQNYLVLANSVLFMETGGNSRLAGYLLAAATFGMWIAGPVVIGFVPVMVVGTLIYMLGIDLAKDTLYGSIGRLDRLEYMTIIVIALVMGLYDFVVGIAIGIGLACLVYVVQTSRKTVIRAEFSGQVAESTVRRHTQHRNYLQKVGPQIRVVKLGGYLFFGSIVKVEKKVRAMVDAEAFAASPIRYLIVELMHVTGIDFSAAEAFARMNRILHRRGVNMSIAGVTLGSDIGKSLSMVGLFDDNPEDPSVPAPKVYEDLNGALEACENELLMVLAEKQKFEMDTGEDSPPIPIPENAPEFAVSPFDGVVGSPRRNLLNQAASKTITETPAETSKWQHMKQPLPLLMQVFRELTDKDESFWFRAVPYFAKRHYTKGQMLYTRGDNPDGFYLLQSGMLRAEYDLDQGNYNESIVAGTTCGELPFFSETERTASVIAERECIAWLLTPEKWEEMQKTEEEVARELLKVSMKLSAERMSAITRYVLITAS